MGTICGGDEHKLKHSNEKESLWAVYRGDTFIFMGTLKECSKYLGVSEQTVRFYSYSSYLKRAKKNALITLKVEEIE